MDILKETQIPPGDDGARAILAFSLGTNDGPQSTDTLEAAVRYSLSRLGEHGCAIWATIARPPLAGVSYKAMNQRLYEIANDPQYTAQLLIVPWAEQYAKHKSWRRSDGVHATPEGYAARAQMYADAARACAA
jgi:lysophospholipase L1-like esterase